MPPRRQPNAPGSINLSPYDTHGQSIPSPSTSTTAFPRSASPSGFSSLLSKPAKWFSRNPSGSRASPSSGTSEPRSSTSSSINLGMGRKPKISHPTDPRPILPTVQSDGYVQKTGVGSRSVYDLSLTRTETPAEMPPNPYQGSPSSPSRSKRPPLGDLRALSRKPWSKSADDLGKLSISAPSSPAAASFTDKVEQYRGSPTKQRQPFPTSGSRSPVSGSPPSGVSLSPLRSASSGHTEPSSPADPPPLLHARSHSFTPKLPSKLSASKLGPPSPQRKGSTASEGGLDDKYPSAGASSSNNNVRAAFPFTFGGNKGGNGAVPAPAPSATIYAPHAPDAPLLPPPKIIEPGLGVPAGDDRRASQITFQTGFLNRMTAFAPPPAHVALGNNKTWKPMKVVLRGTKVQMYKVPGDRAAEVKELFPTRVVPVEEQDLEEVVSSGWLEAGMAAEEVSKDEGRSAGAGRRKRAFWGRRTHPDLVSEEGGVEKGTFEALVHEAVFATRYREGEAEAVGAERAAWQDFASAVLFALPSLVGRVKFEAEFLRCCTYLVNGAEEGDAREAERKRVAWLAGEYMRFWGAPADSTPWEEFRAEIIPDFAAPETRLSNDIVQPSASTQAVHTRSPQLSMMTTTSSLNVLSPHVDTFSPRPLNTDAMLSLTEALRSETSARKSPSKSSQHRPSGSGNREVLWNILEREGFTRDILVRLSPKLIAKSLTAFGRQALESVPRNLTVDVCFTGDGGISEADEGEGQDPPKAAVPPFFGTDDRPHWLTKLILLHVLGPDTSNAFAAHTRKSTDERATQTSRTHTRSEVLAAWARVGEQCRVAGDECAWRAICAALCARPVARLEKAWRRVDPTVLAIVEAWVGQGCVKVEVESRVTPWGGECRETVRKTLERAKGKGKDDVDVFEVVALREAKGTFEDFRTALELCPRGGNVAEEDVPGDMERLVDAWEELCATGGGTGNVASQFIHVDQFMSLSLAAESRRKGLYEPYFWTKASAPPPGLHPLVPLLFPEPIPVVTLINRAQLWRGRLESGAQRLNVQDLPALRKSDIGLRPMEPPQRRSFGMVGGFNTIDCDGTVLPIWEGELLLLIQPGDTTPSRPGSRAPSRPTSTITDAMPIGDSRPTMSRVPSIRVRPGTSHALERKTSLARRSSLPSISARTSLVIPEHPSERPVRVVVQAGTLDRLVEVLAHGLPGVSVSIADDNGEMPLREGMTRDVKLDRSDFATVWWNVFRSFVSPLVFFELLRKRYVSALTPGFSAVDDLLQIARIRREVLDVIIEWLQNGHGAQDILDDSALYPAIHAFLSGISEHEIPESTAKEASSVVQAWTGLKQTLQNACTAFAAHTMRPPIQSLASSEPLPSVLEKHTFTSEAPDLDKVPPEELVDNLDAMACAAFRNVTEEDLFVASDLLEVQTADRLGWFMNRDPSINPDDVEIQTIYSHLTGVQPSSMISELTQDELFRLLPPGLRSCIRAHLVLRKWIITKLVAPRLTILVRQTRMELVLRAIEVCRRRSENSTDADLPITDSPVVPSFVEVVLTSAVLSVESRLHQRAWSTVASSRGVMTDSLAAFFVKPVCGASPGKWPLTADMGWTLERMLEVISLPDVLDSSTSDSRNLVNFDKRRHLCNLIDTTPVVSSVQRSRRRRDIDRRDFERLNNIEREVNSIHLDLRAIREDAYREACQVGVINAPKRSQRPFQRLISVQQEKNKRDRLLRDRLGKERKQEQQRNDKRDDYLTKAMNNRRPYTAVQRQHRMKKSGSSSFFQNLMRPISNAFALDNVEISTVRRTAAELDFVPSGKPALVLSVVDARVSQFINYTRSYTFQLDTEDGGHYLLQAASRPEMMKWIQTIDRVSKTAAKRRLTYLGNSPKPQLADHIHDRPTTASRDPTAVFGVDLEFLLMRESGGAEVPPGTVPSVIERCLSEVEARGLSEVGIYRIAGASSEVNGLKEALNRGEWPVTQMTDIYAVCDLIKSWFRVLPEPVFPSYSYHDIIEAMKIEDFNTRLARMRTVVHALPRYNFDLLKRIVEHLDRVTDYEEHNQMGSDALAIVFSPNLMRAPHNDFVMIMANMPYTNKLVKALMTHSHTIFDEEDNDAEADQEEDEFDEPIPEEDEEPEEEYLGSPQIGFPTSENISEQAASQDP